MTDIRCPMCGKPNSAELEVCIYCQARLKPLIIRQPVKDRPTIPAKLINPPTESIPSEANRESKPSLPDWLSDFREDLPGTKSIEEPIQSEEFNSEADEWFSRLQSNSQINQGIDKIVPSEPISTDKLKQVGALPEGSEDTRPFSDWLTNQVEKDSPNELIQPFIEVPDWVPNLTGSHSVGDTEAPLSWLTEESANKDTTSVESKPDTAEIAEDTVSSESPGTTDAIDIDKEPDWFKQETQEEVGPLTNDESVSPESVWQTQSIDSEPELKPSGLPGWLEAMRPFESSAPPINYLESTYGQLESDGPLAGIRGVIEAGSGISAQAPTSKPMTYSVKIHATELQQKNAGLLKLLLENEGEIHSKSKQSAVSINYIWRILIAIILIIAVVWPLVMNTRTSPFPDMSPETTEVNRLISGLNPNAPVLLAFDYQPGFMGEMDTASAAVVDRLMLRGVLLTIVSTSPVGPIIGEQFIRDVQKTHNYTSPEKYVNLGYIPGGPAGLLSFAQSPQHILPMTLEGARAWAGDGQALAIPTDALPPLRGISSLADFSMVMVIVDDPDTARAWIEQVQPYLEQSPLVMVISAQAEPLLRPYYQSNPRQIQGLIISVRGGAAFASLTGREGQVRNYWDAFNTGLIATILIIGLGGIMNLVLSIQVDQRKK